MSEKRLPNIKRAIQKLTLPELLILAREAQIGYIRLTEAGPTELPELLPRFDGELRHTLSVAFGVPNGQGPKQAKREIRSPIVRRAFDKDTTSANPEVVARDGMGAAFFGKDAVWTGPDGANPKPVGITFTEGAEVPKFG